MPRRKHLLVIRIQQGHKAAMPLSETYLTPKLSQGANTPSIPGIPQLRGAIYYIHYYPEGYSTFQSHLVHHLPSVLVRPSVTFRVFSCCSNYIFIAFQTYKPTSRL